MASSKNNPTLLTIKASSLKTSQEATLLFKALKKKKLKIVFTESCTAGRASAFLCEIPGASEIFCGAFVTYREKTKLGWLGLRAPFLKKYTHVSMEVSLELAKNALKKTKEADLSVGITGHFGPRCLKKEDGIFHIALVLKQGKKKWIQKQSFQTVVKLRKERQIVASHSLFLMVRSLLDQI